MRHSQAIVQVVDVPLLLPAKKAEATEVCPDCGGPAEIDLFWSTSPDCPGVKVLKKQTCCGGRRGRTSRTRVQPGNRCPVRVEIVESRNVMAAAPEPPLVDSCEVVAVAPEPTLVDRCDDVPVAPRQTLPSRASDVDLDQVIQWLSLLDESDQNQLRRLALLTRQLRERAEALQTQLKRTVE